MKPIKDQVMPIIPWKTGTEHKLWNDLIWYYPINNILDKIEMLITETLKDNVENFSQIF